MSEKLSMDEFLLVLPEKMRKNVSQDLVDQINGLISDPHMMEIYRDNLLGFAQVLKEGKFKMEQYLAAVRYVSFKLMGDTNKDAYIKTFPGKYQQFLKDGVSPKDIASYSTAYNKSKLVNLIMEQALVPVHILNAPYFQQAINTQAELMANAKSEMVRMQAANSLMTHLKPPETKKIELDVGYKEDDSIKALRETTMELARQQRAMIVDGSASPKTIAASNLKHEEAEIVNE